MSMLRPPTPLFSPATPVGQELGQRKIVNVHQQKEPERPREETQQPTGTDDVDCLESPWTSWKPKGQADKPKGYAKFSCKALGCRGAIWRTKPIIQSPKGNGKPCPTKEFRSLGEDLYKTATKSGKTVLYHLKLCEKAEECSDGGTRKNVPVQKRSPRTGLHSPTDVKKWEDFRPGLHALTDDKKWAEFRPGRLLADGVSLKVGTSTKGYLEIRNTSNDPVEVVAFTKNQKFVPKQPQLTELPKETFNSLEIAHALKASQSSG
eukprot:GHVQ01013411.1.p1 GENE.GHVQ01013411.1~~GHVQ01013411.1.p1  ORF type:complete len:263 (+),score=23.64 GHVQ01013411.1:296-1084(+)